MRFLKARDSTRIAIEGQLSLMQLIQLQKTVNVVAVIRDAPAQVRSPARAKRKAADMLGQRRNAASIVTQLSERGEL